MLELFQHHTSAQCLLGEHGLKGSVKVAQYSFQHLYLDAAIMVSWYHGMLQSWCHGIMVCCNHGIKKLLNHWRTRCHHFFDIIGYHSNNMTS